jgi:predicted ester cyclase
MQIITDDPTGASEKLKILGEYSERMFAGDAQAVLDYWADDFHSNVTNRVAPEQVGTDVRGEEQEYWKQAQAAFPDMEFTVNLIVEAGDVVVSNWTITGTHTGTAFYELEPTGLPVNINGTAILRFRDGKIVEHWGGPHCQKGLGLLPLAT